MLDLRLKLVLFIFLFIGVSCKQKIDEEKARFFFKLAVDADKRGEHDIAIDFYNKALGYNPGRASIYYNRGLSHLKMNKYKNAISDFNLAISNNDTINSNFYEINCHAHTELANCYFNLGFKEFALEILNMTFSICKDSMPLFSNRCFYNLELKQYENAIADGLLLVEENEAIPFDYFNLSLAYYNTNEYENSLKHLLNYLKELPNDIDANYYAGLNYLELNNNDSAIFYFRKVVEIEPDYKESKEYLEKLKK